MGDVIIIKEENIFNKKFKNSGKLNKGVFFYSIGVMLFLISGFMFIFTSFLNYLAYSINSNQEITFLVSGLVLLAVAPLTAMIFSIVFMIKSLKNNWEKLEEFWIIAASTGAPIIPFIPLWIMSFILYKKNKPKIDEPKIVLISFRAYAVGFWTVLQFLSLLTLIISFMNSAPPTLIFLYVTAWITFLYNGGTAIAIGLFTEYEICLNKRMINAIFWTMFIPVVQLIVILIVLIIIYRDYNKKLKNEFKEN